MRLAVLGTDPDLLALVAAATADTHRIVWLGDVRPDEAAGLRDLLPAAPSPSANWEVLLDHATTDAVLVGRGTADDELRAEQLRRLVAEAVPLLAVHPAVLSVLVYYELDMLRRETGGILRHYNPFVDHPSISDLARCVRDGHDAIGPVFQVSCTRHVAGASREAVLGNLARDVELLAAVAGPIHQVSAVGPRTTGASYASLQVQMSTPSPATLRWSVAPTAGAASGIELTLIGERGTMTWRQVEDSPWRKSRVESQIRRGGSQESRVEDHEPTFDFQLSTPDAPHVTLPPHDAPLAAIRDLADAASSSTAPASESELPAPSGPPLPAPRSLLPALSTWDKATQAMEVVDAVELSLQKGRTIEVHQQHLTEQLAFRGTMAAFGCGLLSVGTLIIIVAALLGHVESIFRWLLGLLAVFLILQVVPFLVSKAKQPSTNEPRQHL